MTAEVRWSEDQKAAMDQKSERVSLTKYDSQALTAFTQSTGPILVQNKHFETTTNIGLRPSQEDRLVLVPSLFHEDISFCSVFDGTVGPHASEFLKNNILKFLIQRPELQHIVHRTHEINAKLSASKDLDGMSAQAVFNYEEIALSVRDALHHAFLDADAQLINMCAQHHLHYASSTGVTAFLWKNLLTVAHVGDSKACIAKVDSDGLIYPEWLTIDHKPNMPNELRRIEQCGGSLAWLHGNKPYIRGGDFLRRQANGEHPKQLNYSRAFGGKDLKMYGLIAEPDINHFEITHDDRLILLASDGLWDVLNPKTACEIAIQAKNCGRSPTQELVERAIRDMPNCNVADNITVIAIFLNE